jgi:hypothetical protein
MTRQQLKISSRELSDRPRTGFSLSFHLLVAYHLKDPEDLYDNNGPASAVLTIGWRR